MWIIHSIYSLLFPSACFICKKSHTEICAPCARHFKRAIETQYTWVYSYYSYKDPSVRLILNRFKYHRAYSLGIALTKTILTSRESLSFFEKHTNTILVPIPMPSTRKNIRGGNHTEHIAKTVAKELSMPVALTLLTRNPSKKNFQQAHAKNKREREALIHNSFILNTSYLKDHPELKGQTIILIDDVVTTGATLQEAKKTLEKQGFKSIKAFTLAH